MTIASSATYAHDLQICKATTQDSSAASGSFVFDIAGPGPLFPTQISVAVGQCTTFANLGGGTVTTITEEAAPGTRLTAISVTALNGLIPTYTANVPQRTVTVTIPEGNTATVTFTNIATLLGRWTGGGSIFTGSGVRITHGFELHCSTADTPNNLEINFQGNQFHLDSLTSVRCFLDSSGIPTITGTGTGHFDGITGYTIAFKFTDAGEPGVNDLASYEITSPANTVVLSSTALLTFGNQQFHKAH